MALGLPAWPRDTTALDLSWERLQPGAPLKELTWLHARFAMKEPRPIFAALFARIDELEQRFAEHPEEWLAYLGGAYAPQRGQLSDAELATLARHQLRAAAQCVAHWSHVPDRVIHDAYLAGRNIDRNSSVTIPSTSAGRRQVAAFVLANAEPLARTLADTGDGPEDRRPACPQCAHAFDLPSNVTTDMKPIQDFEQVLWLALNYSLPVVDRAALHRRFEPALARAALRYAPGGEQAGSPKISEQFLELSEKLGPDPRVQQARAVLHSLNAARRDVQEGEAKAASMRQTVEAIQREQPRLVCLAGILIRDAASDPGTGDVVPAVRPQPKNARLVEVKLSACPLNPLPAATPASPAVLLSTTRPFRYRATFRVVGLPAGSVSMGDADGQVQTWSRFLERDAAALAAELARAQRDEAAARAMVARAEPRLREIGNVRPALENLVEQLERTKEAPRGR